MKKEIFAILLLLLLAIFYNIRYADTLQTDVDSVSNNTSNNNVVEEDKTIENVFYTETTINDPKFGNINITTYYDDSNTALYTRMDFLSLMFIATVYDETDFKYVDISSYNQNFKGQVYFSSNELFFENTIILDDETAQVCNARLDITDKSLEEIKTEVIATECLSSSQETIVSNIDQELIETLRKYQVVVEE